MIPDINRAMFCGALITQGSLCVFKFSMSSFKKDKASHTHTPFWGERKKKQESKIAGKVISSQTGRSLVLGLKVPRTRTEPISKASDFHLLHFLQNYHPEPYPSAT